MTYFNLDLMEQDARRRLKKVIDACAKQHLAEFSKSYEPKIEPISEQIYYPMNQSHKANVYNDFYNQNYGGSGGQQTGGAGIGSWSGL